MVRSLAVILVPLVLITIFFTRNVGAPPVHVVDWKPVLGQARSEANFPIYAPDSVPQGWRVTKVSWVQKGNPDLTGTPVAADQWQLGMLTAQNIYLEIDEQNADSPDFVAANTRKGVKDGQSMITATAWTRLVSDDQRTRSLVTMDNGVTVLVSGDLAYVELESFVKLLTAS